MNPGVDRVVRFDPRNLSQIYLETDATNYLCVPIRDRGLPTFSLWEWLWTRRHHRPLAQSANSEALGGALRDLRQTVGGKTALQGRRRAARAQEWRELQRIQSLPVRNVSMEATVVASAPESSLAWEILE